MKKFLAGVAFCSMAWSSAHAADLPMKAAPAPVAVGYDWSGIYFGGHIGGGWSNNEIADPGLGIVGVILSVPITQTAKGSGFLGGVQGGYDWQLSPSWVIGVEGQYSWIGNHQLNAIFPGGYAYNNNQRGIASVTGRVGYTWGPGLIYVKGGYAYSDNNESVTLGGAPALFRLSDDHSNGWTVGAGAEYMFAPNWSAKVEYQYYDFGDSRFTGPAELVPFGTFHNDEHTVKAGINYRFNLGNFGGPMAARY